MNFKPIIIISIFLLTVNSKKIKTQKTLETPEEILERVKNMNSELAKAKITVHNLLTNRKIPAEELLKHISEQAGTDLKKEKKELKLKVEEILNGTYIEKNVSSQQLIFESIEDKIKEEINNEDNENEEEDKKENDIIKEEEEDKNDNFDDEKKNDNDENEQYNFDEDDKKKKSFRRKHNRGFHRAHKHEKVRKDNNKNEEEDKNNSNNEYIQEILDEVKEQLKQEIIEEEENKKEKEIKELYYPENVVNNEEQNTQLLNEEPKNEFSHTNKPKENKPAIINNTPLMIYLKSTITPLTLYIGILLFKL